MTFRCESCEQISCTCPPSTRRAKPALDMSLFFFAIFAPLVPHSCLWAVESRKYVVVNVEIPSRDYMARGAGVYDAVSRACTHPAEVLVVSPGRENKNMDFQINQMSYTVCATSLPQLNGHPRTAGLCPARANGVMNVRV